ncbi:hypothetical protein OSB04_007599 [Centaurea solstitialis]|uniref:Retrotransposon gag domain-containing protein n=1 Tax=Centaurea solstitialis TaxID=347529 RepID=A0AA38TK76_9ASTR|nr:hypothetical protein OSB04_007599 [Centaurea solstitialis]
MANTVTNTNNLSLRSILEKDKLTGANFLDWERNLMIVLRHERKWYVLEEPLGEAPPANATANVRNAYRKHSDDLLDVGCLMLATMSPDLQTGLMNTNAYDMIRQLRDMFQTQARTERYDATRALNACKMAKGTSVSDHVMKMKKHIDHLERLGHPVPLQLATDTILNSLTEDYKQFVINYNMNNMEKTIAELHSMLKTAELSMGTGTKTKDVLMVGDGRAKRKRGHGNTSKGKSQSQASQSVTKVENDDKRKGKGKKVKPNNAKTENRCFICHELGHWRRNYPKHHKEGNNASGTFYHLPGYKGAYNLVSLSACLGASLGPCHQSGIANLHNVPGLDPARGNSVWSFTGGSISSNPGSHKIPTVPVEVKPKTGFQASAFVDELALVDVPKKYTIPAFATKYSGITDPVEHIAQYKQLMWTVPIPAQYQEVCMCKSFGSTLTGAALQWLINLKPKSIGSFAELVNQFTRQFASSRKMEKQTSDLYYIVQKSGETIRDYFNRFNAAMIEIKNCDVKTAIEAYKHGLEDSSGLYLKLTKYPPENFDDVRARTLAFMRIEDDALFRRKHSAEKKPLGAQKHDFKHKRVNKIGNPRHESKARPGKGTVKIRYPELSTYNFAGTSKDLVDSLRKIDANVRWPKKSDKPSKDKDQNRWCDFHDDHGHTTDECISLKKEISYLKSKGHLKGLIPEEQGRPASPVHTKVVNCITGGSEVCGLTYSAAKRHARDGPDEHPIPGEARSKTEKELDAMAITFDQDDTQGVHHKHHDALVIQLTIGNCSTKRILIDGGSSANVIFADTLKVMGIEQSEIVRRSTTLIGFNGDPMNTLGEIILPVFAKGINKQTKFNVVNCQSAYNVILGRPWIHEMKAIPSTYHQKIKFPSSWGIQEIASENKVARECYKITMKTKSQDI